MWRAGSLHFLTKYLKAAFFKVVLEFVVQIGSEIPLLCILSFSTLLWSEWPLPNHEQSSVHKAGSVSSRPALGISRQHAKWFGHNSGDPLLFELDVGDSMEALVWVITQHVLDEGMPNSRI
ncbi:hypothetical protein GOP47_0013642 [Adiantum capillus-veneris]|uniref:Uncharacterized protein n=1 Tax=Adiantum capillus-veneris TaxID=13818 RepID=A0A9D4UP43_ADICA|nr:hypothetical protein GOP47_0013642 [Adiantum capillus-veneris]